MDSPLRKLYPPSTLERWAPIRHRQNMFDRRIRGWGYKVNHAKDKSNGDATGARTSNRKRKPKGSGDRQARSGMLGTPNETKFSDRDDLQTIPVIQSPDAYLLQEQMLSSVHNYALGVFQSREWKFDPLRTYAPQGSQDFGAIWKDLSDQCFGAGILSRNHGQRREAIMKWSDSGVCAGISTASISRPKTNLANHAGRY